MHLLSAGEEGIPLRHLVSVLSFRRDPPSDACARRDNGAKYDRVRPPVLRLRIPTTGW